MPGFEPTTDAGFFCRQRPHDLVLLPGHDDQPGCQLSLQLHHDPVVAQIRLRTTGLDVTDPRDDDDDKLGRIIRGRPELPQPVQHQSRASSSESSRAPGIRVRVGPRGLGHRDHSGWVKVRPFPRQVVP